MYMAGKKLQCEGNFRGLAEGAPEDLSRCILCGIFWPTRCYVIALCW